jgi:hypothetical protein
MLIELKEDPLSVCCQQSEPSLGIFQGTHEILTIATRQLLPPRFDDDRSPD